MKRLIFLFIIFGCLGTTVEVYFTAIKKFILDLNNLNKLDFSFQGKSYIWMFFIYGMSSILFPLIYDVINDYPIILRLLIYAVVIFLVEFLTGSILDKILGKCPWHYTTDFSILGYIRLDYIFYWMGFGYLLEIVFKIINTILDHGIN